MTVPSPRSGLPGRRPDGRRSDRRPDSHRPDRRPLDDRGEAQGRGLRVQILVWRDTAHPEGGGSERYVERIAAELARQGDEVVVRCARYPGALQVEQREGFVLRRAGGRLTVYPRALLGLLADRLRGRRPDVVLDVQNGVPFFARLVAGCPVVVLVHHVHREQWPVALGPVASRIGWWVESRLAPLVHRGVQYVTVSEVSRAELAALGVDRDRIAVIRNGADPVADLPASAVPADAPATLVVLGRLVPHKRVEHAVRVLARLRARHPDLRLRVIGDGWWRDRLVAEVRRLGVEDAVDFSGHVCETDKHALLAGSTVMLAPSLKEGWGLMVIEAAQHGVPTVAYRQAGGVAESVLDGVTGLLVDDLEGMVAATERLLQDPALRRGLGEIARARASRFTWAAATTSFRRLLRRSARGLPPVSEEDAGAAQDLLLGAVVEDLAGGSLLDLAGGDLGGLRGHGADQGGRGRDRGAPAA